MTDVPPDVPLVGSDVHCIRPNLLAEAGFEPAHRLPDTGF